MATDRGELTSYAYRQLRARILRDSDVCIVCGHGTSDTTDHVIPVSKGGARLRELVEEAKERERE